MLPVCPGPKGSLVVWCAWMFWNLSPGLTDHIPEPGQQLTRNWGYYANAPRGKRRLASPTR